MNKERSSYSSNGLWKAKMSRKGMGWIEMEIGGGEEEYGRKIFEEKKIFFEEEKKNREGKGTKQFVRNRSRTKAEQNKSRTKKAEHCYIFCPP